MSWTIHEVLNTVKITAKCAKELFQADENVYEGNMYHEVFNALDDVAYKGKLNFNPDHSEHMDFLSDEKFIAVLKKNRAKGDIGFADLEGDGTGTFWGYRFDGKGGMTELKGRVEWEENQSS